MGLTRVAQLAGVSSRELKIAGSVPRQGMCLGCGFGPWSGRMWEAAGACSSRQCFPPSYSTLPISVTPMSVSSGEDAERKKSVGWDACVAVPKDTGQHIWELGSRLPLSGFLTQRSSYTRSVRKKSSHCSHNENGLRNINVTWRPRREDWKAHV